MQVTQKKKLGCVLVAFRGIETVVVIIIIYDGSITPIGDIFALHKCTTINLWTN